jgi:2-octaprenyl-6-methoxyphenol hydroxylase
MLLDRRPQPVSLAADGNSPVTVDVAIVGGGIVGLVVACGLIETGLRVAIIEALPQATAAKQAQAYAFSLASARIFQGLGLWDRVRSELEPFHRIRLSDCDWPDVVEFHPQEADHATDLGYVAAHQTLLTALQERVNQAANLTWIGPATATVLDYGEPWAELAIAPNGPDVDCPERLRAKLVVAADGARSPLREAAGIPSRGWAYWQSCIVTAVKAEYHHQNIAYERFQTGGPFAILPLGDVCRLVWTEPHAEAQSMLNLDDDRFLQELSQRFGPQMGRLELVGQRYLFPVRLMQCDRYTAHRLALVGDAAHCCHPLGGQGLNMGIRDAAALVEVLQGAISRGEDFGQLSVLRRYDRWRRWGNWTILVFTDMLDRVFSTRLWPVVWVRRAGLAALKRIPLLKSLALKLMTGLLGKMPALGRAA